MKISKQKKNIFVMPFNNPIWTTVFFTLYRSVLELTADVENDGVV